MSSQMVMGVLAYGLAINLLGYAAMVLDKARAENRSRRIPEATLLNLALLGGSVGTVLAQQTIRHKTRKEPFRSKLVGIIVLQVLALVALVIALLVGVIGPKLRFRPVQGTDGEPGIGSMMSRPS